MGAMGVISPWPMFICLVVTVLLYNGGCKADVGTPCTDDDPSNCTAGEICSGGSCACNTTTHYQSGSNCVAKIALSKTCDNSLVGVVQCVTSGAVCATDNKCRCNTGTFDSNGFGTADGVCVDINNLVVSSVGFSNLGTNSVTISWTTPSTYSGQVSRYEVTWTSTAGNGNKIGDTSTSLEVTGLQSASQYSFYVRTIESGSQTTEQQVTTTPLMVTTKSLLGNTCGDCADPNAICSTKCVCDSGYYDSDGDTTNVGGTCTQRLNPGMACTSLPTNACKDNSVCTNTGCTCNEGYYDSDGSTAIYSGTCAAKIALSVSCNSALTGVSQCSDGNAECTGGNVCRCQAGFFDSDGYVTNGGTCTSMSALKVTGVSVTPGTDTVSVTWTPPSNTSQVDKYQVIWTPPTSNGITSQDVSKSASSASISGFTSGTTYTFNVKTLESGSRTVPQEIESDPPTIVSMKATLSVSCGSGSPVVVCEDTTTASCTSNICRCKDGYFDSNGYDTSGGVCTPMSKLLVTGITLVKEGTDTVNISWTPPSEYTNQLNRYDVHWTPAALINGKLSHNAQLTTAVQLVGFTPGQTYTFSVFSVESGSREYQQSSPRTASPITMKPATPSGFTETDVDGPEIILSWTLPSGIRTSYDVITTPTLTPITTSTESITYSSGVLDGQRYNITITTVSGSERSDPLEATFRTVSKTPNPPTSIYCKAATDQTITLGWAAPSQSRGDIQHYVVISITTGAMFTTTSSLVEYTVGGLQPETIYTFSVATVNDAVTYTNRSIYSSQIGCTTKAASE